MAAGTIRKRETKQGIRWQAIVDLGPDPQTGKRRQRSRFCTTEREAKKALAQLLVEADSGRLAPRTSQTIADAAERWLDQYARFKSPKTYEDYERTVRVHVLPQLGRHRVQDLRASHLRSWITGLLKVGKGTRTVELALLRVRQVLDVAVADGCAPANVARSVEVPQPAERAAEHQTWTAQEAQSFLQVAAAAEGGYGPIWLISLATGMRRGELLGLRWADVDWDHETLRVRQAVGPIRGKVEIKTLKGKNATRDVQVDPIVLEALRAHRAKQNAWRLQLGAAWDDHDLIFASEIGTPVNPNNLYRVYVKLVAAAGVPKIRIHDQRHTHVTWALEEGADLKAVSRRVGHSKTAITSEVYQRVTAKLQTDVVAKVSLKLFSAAT